MDVLDQYVFGRLLVTFIHTGLFRFRLLSFVSRYLVRQILQLNIIHRIWRFVEIIERVRPRRPQQGGDQKKTND